MFLYPHLGTRSTFRISLLSNKVGSGCGSVGRAVASDTRGPQFESRHRQNFTLNLYLPLTLEKTKTKKKRPEMAHL